ncbi:MAG: SBBP repeat-containing protein, partial [Calditrichota bacterium]
MRLFTSFLTTALLFCLSLPLFSEKPSTTFWERHIGGSGNDLSRGIACNQSGSIFLTGVFDRNVELAEYSLSSSGKNDIFLGKINPAGEVEWIHKAGGSGNDMALDVAADNFGNSYLAGTFEDIMFFKEDHYLQAIGFTDAFVAKFDAKGEILWQRNFGGNYKDFCSAVSSDHLGNLLIAGSFENDAVFGQKILTGFGKNDAFVAKLDRQTGEPIWLEELGGGGEDFAWDVITDYSGNIYLSGEFNDIALIGDAQLTSRGSSDIFIIKFSPTGKPLWVRQLGGNGQDTSRKLAIDRYGSIYLAGNFTGTALFDDKHLTSLGQNDVFIASFTPEGQLSWAKRAGGVGADQVYALAVNQQRECLITGEFTAKATFGESTVQASGETDLFLASLTVDGKWNSVEALGGNFHESGSALAVDRENRLLISGIFEDSILLGAERLIGKGERDTFLARFTSNRSKADNR